MGFPKEYASELQECYGTHLSLSGAYYEVARNYSSGMDVPKAREREGTSGIMAMELPSEETRQGHIGTKARLVDDEEGMIGKVELDDGENATNKKIKKEVVVIHGLTEAYEEDLKNCNKRTIDMVECYYYTTLRPRFNEEPVKYVTTETVEEGCGEANDENPSSM
ncbi:hypothetical protein CTI12_AA556530 [Artemisia annua]|uniref:Uncharacterized protein n=1 Tax=Artemisia annua TaxID=35608 RepID=A0A2U1KW02_ARTAN|nr:hypothetical protein CTI12_AA556530 [Artemisia annua]